MHGPIGDGTTKTIGQWVEAMTIRESSSCHTPTSVPTSRAGSYSLYSIGGCTSVVEYSTPQLLSRYA
eukprot:2869896-Rhodomonas_salina.3